jgi:ribosomal protein S21
VATHRLAGDGENRIFAHPVSSISRRPQPACFLPDRKQILTPDAVSFATHSGAPCTTCDMTGAARPTSSAQATSRRNTDRSRPLKSHVSRGSAKRFTTATGPDFRAICANILNMRALQAGLPRQHLVSDAPIASLLGCANVIYLPGGPCVRLAYNNQRNGILVQVLVRDNNVDQALRALKKKMQREGIFREMKMRDYYEKPSQKRAREKAEAVRRVRKLARKRAQREGLIGGRPGAR